MENDRIVIALTRRGAALAERIARTLPVDVKVPQRFLANPDEPNGFAESVATVIAAAFTEYRALILIMAAGVAVRSIAPLLRGKQEDPAVVVLDEEGRFVISLLSGHLGGANELAVELAQRLGGTAVVTTASDLQNLPALDLIAQRQNMRIENPQLLPRFAAALVNGDPVVLWDRWGLRESWPEQVRVDTGISLQLNTTERLLIVTGYQRLIPLPLEVAMLGLRPRCLTVGIGCCRGVTGLRISGAIRRYFRERNWSPLAIKQLATIDIKADEPGLIKAGREFDAPLVTFSAAELETVMPGLAASEVVTETTGVGGVCEPAAILASNRGALIGAKENMREITIAVALEEGASPL